MGSSPQRAHCRRWPGSVPAPRGQQEECGGQRPVKTFFFFFFLAVGREKLFLAARAPATWLQGLLRARWASGLQKCGLDSELFLETSSAGGRSQRGGRGVQYRRALCVALHSILNARSPVEDREGPRKRWLRPNSRRHCRSWTPHCSPPEHFLFRN